MITINRKMSGLLRRMRPHPAGLRFKSNDEDSIKTTRVIRCAGVAAKGAVLLRTSAVRVINQTTGRSTLAYAQHDTASQALISDSLKQELGLEVIPDPSDVVLKTGLGLKTIFLRSWSWPKRSWSWTILRI